MSGVERGDLRHLRHGGAVVVAVSVRADHMLIGLAAIIRVGRRIADRFRSMGRGGFRTACCGIHSRHQDKQRQERRKQRRHPTLSGREESHIVP